MNAPNPLAALLGALPVTVNLTINGGVHIGDVVNHDVTILDDTTDEPKAGDLSVDGIVITTEVDADQVAATVESILNTANGAAPFVAAGPVFEAKLAPLKVRPTVGRIVHYLPTDDERIHHGSKGNTAYAAIVTGVLVAGEGTFEDGVDIVSLIVFPPCRKPFVPDLCVPEGKPDEKGAWHWPVQA